MGWFGMVWFCLGLGLEFGLGLGLGLGLAFVRGKFCVSELWWGGEGRGEQEVDGHGRRWEGGRGKGERERECIVRK